MKCQKETSSQDKIQQLKHNMEILENKKRNNAYKAYNVQYIRLAR